MGCPLVVTMRWGKAVTPSPFLAHTSGMRIMRVKRASLPAVSVTVKLAEAEGPRQAAEGKVR